MINIDDIVKELEANHHPVIISGKSLDCCECCDVPMVYCHGLKAIATFKELQKERQLLYDAGMPTSIEGALSWLDRLVHKCSWGDALDYKLQYLIDWVARNRGLPEHCFTFPDGDTWCTSEYREKKLADLTVV